MSSSSDQDFDNALRDWVARHEPAEDALAKLKAEILARAAESDLRAGASVQSSVAARSDAWPRSVWIGGSIAAAIAVALSIVWHASDSGLHRVARGPEPLTENGSLLSSVPEVSQLDLAKAALFRELKTLFPRELAWFGEMDGRIHIGIDDAISSNAAADQFIVVRFDVMARPLHSDRWRTVRRVEFVAQEEAVVESRGEGVPLPEVSMWCYVLPDGMIAIDADLRLAIPAPIHITNNSLQNANVPVEILSFERDGQEYRVYQSVATLKNEDVG